MQNVNKLIDLLKIKMYQEYLYDNHLYHEGDSDMHLQLTKYVVDNFIKPLNISLDARIIDMGCGPGYFLDAMKTLEYTNLEGITLSDEDIKINESKGHKVNKHDISFLPQREGYLDECADMLFVRHVLEHSPYPIFTLMEYNRVLKSNGLLYIETPAPDCERGHEFNPNHYSVFGARQLVALLERTGFELVNFQTIDYKLNINDKEIPEQSLMFIAKKKKSLDIK